MQEIQFYQDHLNRVSRSFAFCIQELPMPFRYWVSLSYLICRILDTVEDSKWESPEMRKQQFAAFDAFMKNPPSSEEVQTWAQRFPEDVPEGEKLLLNDANTLFQNIHELAPEIKKVLQTSAAQMSRGMQSFLNKGSLRLTSLKKVNLYCYFVAGLVGKLLTQLFLLYKPQFSASKALKKNALHFGLFLQKVNILKDQNEDEQSGRHLVPDREAVIASAQQNAEAGLDYILSLPLEEKGYRTFCAWSFFLGLATLAKGSIKMVREETSKLLAQVQDIAADNSALKRLFEKFHQLGT
ncbi:MAG: squalene/phytoene synthase family protein [Verrucomicrobia bacterium]|nr:squalene/phytoene synthase family protein [Verrucomicrobiota bacterium]